MDVLRDTRGVPEPPFATAVRQYAYAGEQVVEGIGEAVLG